MRDLPIYLTRDEAGRGSGDLASLHEELAGLMRLLPGLGPTRQTLSADMARGGDRAERAA
jgi:hypothetical protein